MIYKYRPYHKHTKIRCVARHAEYCGFEVSLVASQVNEGDHFGRLLTDLHPVQCAVVWFVYHIT